jgi:hypothetical protein
MDRVAEIFAGSRIDVKIIFFITSILFMTIDIGVKVSLKYTCLVFS